MNINRMEFQVSKALLFSVVMSIDSIDLPVMKRNDTEIDVWPIPPLPPTHTHYTSLCVLCV